MKKDVLRNRNFDQPKPSPRPRAGWRRQVGRGGGARIETTCRRAARASRTCCSSASASRHGVALAASPLPSLHSALPRARGPASRPEGLTACPPRVCVQCGPGRDGEGVHRGRGPPRGVRKPEEDVLRVSSRPAGERWCSLPPFRGRMSVGCGCRAGGGGAMSAAGCAAHAIRLAAASCKRIQTRRVGRAASALLVWGDPTAIRMTGRRSCVRRMKQATRGQLTAPGASQLGTGSSRPAALGRRRVRARLSRWLCPRRRVS